jgi:hypothetical protein
MITRAMNSLDIIEAVPLIEEIFGPDIPWGDASADPLNFSSS